MDINNIRSQFPILKREVSGRPLVYLDNTATSQTPTMVVDEIVRCYTHCKANVHRGVHTLSQEATDLQESTREKVRAYINAKSIQEIVFTRGTTEAINLVAATLGRNFKDGDEIILTVMEHHANIVPWQLAIGDKNVKINVVELNQHGELNIQQYKSFFNDRTVLASFCHVSNVLGTVNPIKEMIDFAHQFGTKVLIDGAQASPHLAIDVEALDCDFYVFSSHKMYGPTGVGVLYGKKQLLDSLTPYQGGGEMIKHVTFEKTTYADLPFKFEAGTPDFVDIAAFAKALDFIQEIGIDNIARHEEELLNYATEQLLQIPGLRIYGTSSHKSAVISFLVGDIHPYDICMLLDKLGIAVRTGHHCAQPLMDYYEIPGTVRASFAVYNTKDEVDSFIAALKRILPILS